MKISPIGTCTVKFFSKGIFLCTRYLGYLQSSRHWYWYFLFGTEIFFFHNVSTMSENFKGLSLSNSWNMDCKKSIFSLPRIYLLKKICLYHLENLDFMHITVQIWWIIIVSKCFFMILLVIFSFNLSDYEGWFESIVLLTASIGCGLNSYYDFCDEKER